MDNIRTQHTNQVHVVERFQWMEGGKILRVSVTVDDDPGAFNKLWSAAQRWRRRKKGPIIELICAKNATDYFPQ